MSNRKFNTKYLFAVMAQFKNLQIKPNHKVSKFINYIISIKYSSLQSYFI